MKRKSKSLLLAYKTKEMLDMFLSELKVVSVNENWIDEKEDFMIEWMLCFIKEKTKSIDVAFIMHFDQLGYKWFRSLSFVEELPTQLVNDHMMFRLVKPNGKEFSVDLNKVKSELDEDHNYARLKLSKALTIFFHQ